MSGKPKPQKIPTVRAAVTSGDSVHPLQVLETAPTARPIPERASSRTLAKKKIDYGAMDNSDDDLFEEAEETAPVKVEVDAAPQTVLTLQVGTDEATLASDCDRMVVALEATKPKGKRPPSKTPKQKTEVVTAAASSKRKPVTGATSSSKRKKANTMPPKPVVPQKVDIATIFECEHDCGFESTSYAKAMTLPHLLLSWPCSDYQVELHEKICTLRFVSGVNDGTQQLGAAPEVKGGASAAAEEEAVDFSFESLDAVASATGHDVLRIDWAATMARIVPSG
jgi:hypothetical protein